MNNKRIGFLSILVAFLMVLSFSFAQAAHRQTDVQMSAADKELAKKVYTALEKEYPWKFTDIIVKSYNGGVVLSGEVEEQKNADKAIEIAKRVPGVKSVENEMNLKSSR